MEKKLVIPFGPIVKAGFADNYNKLLMNVDLDNAQSATEARIGVKSQSSTLRFLLKRGAD
jgi:hypothetical protein